MMAAAVLAERGGFEIILFEKNDDLGRKVKISGGGRCNVTTGLEDLKEVLSAYPRGPKFFRTALYEFSPGKIQEWFEAHGVELKTEKDMRVFPISDNGKDVVGAFEKIFEKNGVKVLFNKKVESVEKEGDAFLLNGELKFDVVMLTTGGQAYRHTGSEGDGYNIAESLGHSITKLGPSLNSFMVSDQFAKNLSGVSFGKVRLKMAGQEFEGPIIFTHKGVSGPATFALSSLCAFEKITPQAPLEMRIDFCPDESYESLREEFMKEPQKNLSTLMAQKTTKSFVREYCAAHSLDFDKKIQDAGKKNINKAIEALKNTKLSVGARLPGDEFVTAGGIELKEVDSKTMQSRICPGLYFAGEILNIDGFTGGYNLQVAWATGALAGSKIEI